MQWLSPQWLWLLGALAIPLLIHLFRRNASREITFAAVQWLEKKRSSRKRLLLRDKWLLLLRMLLLALLALLLSQPLWRDQSPTDGNILLVDPRIEEAQLKEFLKQAPPFAESFWLQAEPIPVSEPQPQPVDLWKTLSTLATAGKFRRAHILLRSAQNPAGHSALQVSPHWQWHTLETAQTESAAVLPRLALLGPEPPWLAAALQQLRDTKAPQLELQKLETIEAANASEQDWLIYNNAGPLPAALEEFVRAGGLLITDQRVRAQPEMHFVEIAGDKGPQAAALGRGSWLRYTQDWHQEAFFRRPALPENLWQQWFEQDWALQTQHRGLWSAAAPPGIAVPDTEVQGSHWVSLSQWLLLALVLLLALERCIALARPVEGGEKRG
ncbi:BatA domain-containing protein [Microbulbifer thermotolerans]|uniref:BatA domain-containing protein n=1 Tax=Microbulbifer thermotolerans TaxID=252514 RepID=UPI002248DCB4|nr:BatA domain-containing protein [Microbulbifer thermotolerans]MCX2830318.1 BatA domain-containing protein [Microbulbifer thermotolerans]